VFDRDRDHDDYDRSHLHTLDVADQDELSIQAREVRDSCPVVSLQLLYGHPKVLGYSVQRVAGRSTMHVAS
jgi:hypothetical protein